MPLDKGLLRENAVPVDRARRHAATRFMLDALTPAPGTANWLGARLAEPALIYDLNGEPLFYDFPVVSGRTPLGLVRASANRVLGVGALTVYVTAPGWDLARATQRAARLAARSRLEVLETRPVCYAYPKLGIEVKWRGPGGKEGRTIYDAADLSIVPEQVEPGVRGAGASSLFDAISKRAVPKALEGFARDDQIADHLEERLGDKLMLAQLDWTVVNALTIAKIIKTWYSAHLNLTLHPQETPVWCTVATGQMILEYHGLNYTQTQVATAMGTTSSGTSWGGEETGLEALTNHTYKATCDYSPTFAKARSEINAGCPFDYSYPQHSMACSGYRYRIFTLWGGGNDSALELYDPWPPPSATNPGGAIRWEIWGAANVAGFVTLRPV